MQSQMRSDFVEKSLGLTLSPSPITFERVVTDSRKVEKGDLFVALRGEQFDGHQFLKTAIEKGATGVVFEDHFEFTPSSQNVKSFRVKDSLQAYRTLGHCWRKTFNLPVVAVAGSVGKTTTKELLAAILRGKYQNVHKTLGSQNGFVGIPMTLLEMNQDTKASVIEVGIDDVGAMIQHMPLIAPHAAILSAIGPEHLENLKNLETVAFEESIALRETLKLGGVISINLDDPWIAPLARELASTKTYTYSLNLASSSEPSRFVRGELSADGSILKVNAFEKPAFELKIPLLGEHNARNLLGATCVALSLGLTPDEITKGLTTFEGVSGRSEIKRRDGHVFICDYYNANPTSMRAAFEMAANVSKELPHFACLADMLELGVDEEKYHRELAASLKNQNWKEILLFGTRMKWLADEIKKTSQIQLRHFETKEALKAALLENLKTPSVVLIKGSRSMKMEEVFAL